MTADELARSYFSRAAKRMLALRVLMDAAAYPDVVREAQEIVELALKGMLRAIGVDPPKWHDVGTVLIEHRDKLPSAVAAEADALAAISLRLRRDREAAFYGDIDLIPEHVFDRDAAERALAGAERVLRAVEPFGAA
jgi:HEPN domain-containing protein